MAKYRKVWRDSLPEKWQDKNRLLVIILITEFWLNHSKLMIVHVRQSFECQYSESHNVCVNILYTKLTHWSKYTIRYKLRLVVIGEWWLRLLEVIGSGELDWLSTGYCIPFSAIGWLWLGKSASILATDGTCGQKRVNKIGGCTPTWRPHSACEERSQDTPMSSRSQRSLPCRSVHLKMGDPPEGGWKQYNGQVSNKDTVAVGLLMLNIIYLF